MVLVQAENRPILACAERAGPYGLIFVADALIKYYQNVYSFHDQNPEKEGFENIVGKGENAGNQHFLLFQQCFLRCPGQI